MPTAHRLPLVLTLGLAGLFHTVGRADQVRRPAVGDAYRVETKSTMTGVLALPPEKEGDPPKTLDMTGSSKVVYRERVLAANADGKESRVFRIYDQIDYRRKVGEQDQKGELRDEVHRILIDRKDGESIPYSPDGPLQWTDLELLRQHELLPVLMGLFPATPFAVGQRWPADPEAVRDLLGVDKLESGGLDCIYHGVIASSGRNLGQVGMAGSILGTGSEGRTRNAVTVGGYFDPASGRLVSLRAVGKHEILDAAGKAVGKLDVDFQFIVTPLADEPELSDAAIGKLPPAMTEALTALQYEHPGLGVRFKHPRDWMLAEVKGTDILLVKGPNTLLMHLEPPGKTPTVADFHKDALAFLAKSKIPTRAYIPPQEAKSSAGRIGRFALTSVHEGKPTVLEYWLWELGDRGVTCPTRLLQTDYVVGTRQVESVVRSMEFFAPALPIDPDAKPAEKPAK